jgi:hypothetical protein
VFLELLLLSVIIVAIALLGLATQIIFKKNGKFPNFRVGHNREMRKKGIYCVKAQEKIILKEYRKKGEKSNPECVNCGYHIDQT